MTNSEAIDLELWSLYEKDIEEIIVDSGSDEDYDDEFVPNKFSKQCVAAERESERRKNINLMYSTIQEVLGITDVEEPKITILKKATTICQQLGQDELNLKFETESLLQKNWKLKRRVEKLQKKKKRKNGPATIARRSSGPPIPSPNKTSTIEKRSASIDDSKMIILQNNVSETLPSIKEMEEEVSSPRIVVQKNPKRKIKKRSGLTDEEKEFYKLEEKIEDILYEVEALWTDVKNDEENNDKDEKKVFDDGKIIPVNTINPSGPSHDTHFPKFKEKIKVTDINKLIEPELNIKKKEVIKVTNINNLKVADPQPSKNRDLIKITNISKLLDPVQNPIITTHDSTSVLHIHDEKRRSSTSGDESPRLIIDESPQSMSYEEQPSRLSQREKDVMECLQAVDTLCLSLVADEPTSEQPVVVEIKKVNNPILKPDAVIAISDSEDDTTNSDIVVIE